MALALALGLPLKMCSAWPQSTCGGDIIIPYSHLFYLGTIWDVAGCLYIFNKFACTL